MLDKSCLVLVTGASRGLGLGVVKRLLEEGHTNVMATCRSPDKAGELGSLLTNHDQRKAVKLDVSDDESVGQLASYLKDNNLSVKYLVNNAGISTPGHPVDDPSAVIRQHMMDVFNTNVAGVASVTTASGVLNTKGGRVLNISSSLGSIGACTGYNATSYRCSKAALNMLTMTFSLAHPDTVFTAVHPGWVKTDMGSSGGRTADITIEESVRGLYKVLGDMDNNDMSGKFVDWCGKKLTF